MKLVIVGQTPPPFNGQAKIIKLLVDELSKKYDVRFVRMGFSDSVSSAGKFSLKKVGMLFSLVVRTWKALGLRRRRYLYYPPASPNLVPVLRDICFLALVRPFCRGVIFHFHAGGLSLYAEKNPFLRSVMKLVYGRISLGIMNGASCPDDAGYFQAKNKVVAPCGLDVDGSFLQLGNKQSSTVLRIVYVGIHTEEKGVFMLLETARILKNRNISFRIRTVGQWYTAEEESRFLAKRISYGLQGQVECVGRKIGDELWGEYASADVLFFPTRYPWETMGIVLLEAMAYQLPVVASDWQGPRDVVVDGETGFLCQHDLPEAFADKLELLSVDHDLRIQMGNAGREQYELRYTAKHYFRRIEQAFRLLEK